MLQAEDAAARCHSLRRQRLEISWRLVFGLDVQHMVSHKHCTKHAEALPNAGRTAACLLVQQHSYLANGPFDKMHTAGCYLALYYSRTCYPHVTCWTPGGLRCPMRTVTLAVPHR